MTARQMVDYINQNGWSKHLSSEEKQTNRARVSYSDYYAQRCVNPLEIEKVVFNPPATIILWADKTKTVVKCQGGEPFDPEKGMAMAFMKKARGNTGRYFKEIDKWCKPYQEKEAAENHPELVSLVKIADVAKATKESVYRMDKKLKDLKQIIEKMGLNKNESGDVNE